MLGMGCWTLRSQRKTGNWPVLEHKFLLRLSQYKWLMQTYVTPVKLNQYDSNIQYQIHRYKCNQKREHGFHGVWQGREIRKFWKDLKDMLEQIISHPIPLDPTFLLMDLYPKDHSYNKS